jgi:hypothetical protein
MNFTAPSYVIAGASKAGTVGDDRNRLAGFVLIVIALRNLENISVKINDAGGIGNW